MRREKPRVDGAGSFSWSATYWANNSRSAIGGFAKGSTDGRAPRSPLQRLRAAGAVLHDQHDVPDIDDRCQRLADDDHRLALHGAADEPPLCSTCPVRQTIGLTAKFAIASKLRVFVVLNYAFAQRG